MKNSKFYFEKVAEKHNGTTKSYKEVLLKILLQIEISLEHNRKKIPSKLQHSVNIQ